MNNTPPKASCQGMEGETGAQDIHTHKPGIKEITGYDNFCK